MPTVRNKDKRFSVNVEESGPPPPTAKRPMNGFMLFAQKYRLQLIQQFPGRDNRLLIFRVLFLIDPVRHSFFFTRLFFCYRAISVMLGDAWKRLNPSEKEMYTVEAHMRAEEYRRLYPDCWKRKRSKSTS